MLRDWWREVVLKGGQRSGRERAEDGKRAGRELILLLLFLICG
jgi:hypothetical protein